MPQSQFRGVDAFKERLFRTGEAMEFQMDAANKAAAIILQQEVVQRVPVDTGETRAAFADAGAVRRSSGFKNGWKFGLVTAKLRARGYKAKWLEYGTKGYSAGSKRVYQRRDPKGRVVTAKTKITRDIPARPVFRPGIEAARARIEALWRQAMQKAVRLEGKSISSRQLEDA